MSARAHGKGRARRWVAALLLLTSLGSAAAEEEAASHPERDAVEAVLAQTDPQERAKALAALPTRRGVDPWIVAERLRVRLGAGEADAYARAAAADDTRLHEYLGRAPPFAYDPAVDAAQDQVRAAIHAETWAEGAGHAERAMGLLPRGCVWRLEMATLRAMCLDADGDLRGATQAWNEIGSQALGLGWHAGARLAFGTAFTIAHPAGLWQAARDADMGVFALQHAQRDLLGQAHTALELAQIAQKMGDLGTAQRRHDQAVELYEGCGKPQDALEARIQRCRLLAEAGLLRDALDEEEEIAARMADARSADLALDHSNLLALLHWYLGDLQRADDAMQKSLAALQGERDGLQRAETLGLRALLEREAGRPAAAAATLREALKLTQAGGDRPLTLNAEANLADALLLQTTSTQAAEPAADGVARERLLSECQALLEAALAGFGELGMVALRLAAEETRARLRLERGEREQARADLRRIAQEAESLGHWRAVVEARSTLAALLVEEGQNKEAMSTAREGIRTLDAVRSEVSPRDRLGSMQWQASLHDLGLAASVGANDLEEAQRFLESGRAAALLRGLGGRAAALRAAVSREALAELESAAELKRERIAAYHKLLGKPGSRAAWTAYEEALRREDLAYKRVEREEAALARRLVPPQAAGVAEIQRRLQGLESAGRPCRLVSFSLQPKRLLALVLGPAEARVVVYPEEATQEIRAALGALVAQLSLPAPRWTERPTFVRTPPQALATLRERLVVPLGLPEGPSSLLVCPDRELAFVPYPLLLDPRVTVALEPSASVWDRLHEHALLRGEGVLAVGNPDYRQFVVPELLASRGGLALKHLPMSQDEVVAITPEPTRDLRLLGPQATETRLRLALEQVASQARRLRSVHLACHGIVDVEWPTLSSLALTAGEGEDGFLTAGEIMRTTVPADLVVLSACRTGRGRVVQGEGVLSLARAFMEAGAPRVLASLWDVDDSATAFLMKSFHEHWRRGEVGVAEALRRAQEATRTHEFEDTVLEEGKPPRRETRRWWSDPEYWAAWVLWGLPE